MKARIIQEPRCVLLWRFDEKSAGFAKRILCKAAQSSHSF